MAEKTVATCDQCGRGVNEVDLVSVTVRTGRPGRPPKRDLCPKCTSQDAVEATPNETRADAADKPLDLADEPSGELTSTAASKGSGLTVSALEQWLWDAACEIRGPLDAPKFKDYILPLVFLKRLSDVFDDEIATLVEEFASEDAARELVEADHSLARFFIPEAACWSTIAKKTTGLGEHLTDAVRAVARENPRLQGVIDVEDFNATTQGQRIVDDPRLQRLVQVLGRHRLGLDDVEPDIFGRAYEYLLRKFAEGGGASAGEFRGRPRRHDEQSTLHRERQAPALRPGYRQPDVEPGLPARRLRARSLRPLRSRDTAILDRGLGLGAAHGALPQ